MRIFLMNDSVSSSSRCALGFLGTSINFKPLPNTEYSALEKFSFAKLITNFLFKLARSFSFLDLCDCLRVLELKWHVRDLILSLVCLLLLCLRNFLFLAILLAMYQERENVLCFIDTKQSNGGNIVISLFRRFGGSEKSLWYKMTALMFRPTFVGWFVFLSWNWFGRFWDPSTFHPFQSFHGMIDDVKQAETLLTLSLWYGLFQIHLG